MASIVRPEPASGSAQAGSDGAPASSISFSGKVLVARDAALVAAGDVAAGGKEVVAVGGATSVTAGGGDAAEAVALNGLAAFRGRLR